MKKTYFASALFTALISGGLFAQTLVTVNGQDIDSSVIDNQVKALQAGNNQIQDTPALRQNLTERQVVVTVVGQEAKRLKLDQSDEYKQALKQARASAKESGADKKATFKTEWAAFEGDLLGQAYAAHVAKQNPVQESDIQTAYRDFSNFYKGSQEVQLGEVLTRSESDAKKAISALKSKKSFANVVKQYSIDEQAKQTGGAPQSYIPLKDLQQAMPTLYNAVKDLKKGGYTTEPLRNGNIYGVFYVHDRRNVQLPTYEEAKNDIGRNLQAARIDASIQSLLQKANIKPAK